MSPDEALRLCRLAKALSPAQAVDEFTPEAWAVVLRDTRYVDAEQALMELGGEQEWVHVSHIKQRVRQIRGRRILEVGMPEPPDGLSDDDYRDWYRETYRRVADGEQAQERRALAEPSADHAARRDALLAGAKMPEVDA